MSILYPVFVLVALTAFTLIRLGIARFRAVKSGRVPIDHYKTYQDLREPDHVRVLSNHYSNLFEAPLLFYVATLVILITGRETVLTVGLAWIYVLLRIVHSFVHTTSNSVLWRFRVFGVSWMVLIALWVVIAVGTLLPVFT